MVLSSAEVLAGGLPVLDREVSNVGGSFVGTGSVSESTPERLPEVEEVSVPCKVPSGMSGLGSVVSHEIAVPLLSTAALTMMESFSQSFGREEAAPLKLLGRDSLEGQNLVGALSGDSSKPLELPTAKYVLSLLPLEYPSDKEG